MMKLSLSLLITLMGNTAQSFQGIDGSFLVEEREFDRTPHELSLQFEDIAEYKLGNATCKFNFTELISSDEVVCTQDLEAPSTSTVTGRLYGGNCTIMTLNPPDILNVTVSKPTNTSTVSVIQFSTIPVAEVQGDISLIEFCLKTIVKEDDFEMYYVKTPIAIEFQYDGNFRIVTGASQSEIQSQASSSTTFTPIAYTCNPDFTPKNSSIAIGDILYVCIIPSPDYKDVKIDRVNYFDLFQSSIPPGQAPNSNPTPFIELTSGTCFSGGYTTIDDESKCVEAMEAFGKTTGGYGIQTTNNAVEGCSYTPDDETSSSFDVDLFLNSGTCNTNACECSESQPCLCQKNCIWCDNRATDWIKNNDKGELCRTAVILQRTKCNMSNFWITNKWCQLSCYSAGNGYEGDICCNAYIPDTVALLITDFIPNPTTIVVQGSVNVAPSETITKSQVERGLIIGTRMSADFFETTTEVKGIGEITFASARRHLSSKLVFSRNLQEASAFNVKIDLQPGRVNSNSVLNKYPEMNTSIIVIILCILYYFD